MSLKGSITIPMTKSHIDFYVKHKAAFLENSTTAKRKAFLDFLSNKKELELIGNLPDFACNIHNWNLDPSDYQSILRHFIYETLVSKTYNCLNRMNSLAENMEATFKSEFGKDFKYHMIKSLTKYYKTKIKIWGIDYQLTRSGDPVNFTISSSDKLYDILDDFLSKFLSLSKEGEFFPDEVLLEKGVIKSKEDYLQRFSQKFLNYRKMIIENSSNPNANIEVHEYFPNIIVIGVKSYIDFDDIAETEKETLGQFKLPEVDKEMLQVFDFYFIGLETLNIDACIRLDQLFK